MHHLLIIGWFSTPWGPKSLQATRRKTLFNSISIIWKELNISINTPCFIYEIASILCRKKHNDAKHNGDILFFSRDGGRPLSEYIIPLFPFLL